MRKPETNKEMHWNWPTYCVWKLIRLYVDKKAYVDKGNTIHYSLWDKVKRVAVKKEVLHQESRRIFDEMYSHE